MGRIWRILLAGLIVVILSGFIYFLTASREPVYKGKSLSVWLAEYNKPMSWPRKAIPADEAVKNMGSRSFPFIVQRLRWHDSIVKVQLLQFLRNRMHLPLQSVSEEQYQLQAVQAMRALGRESKPLIPALAESFDHVSFPAMATAVSWLGTLGVDGEAAIPALIQMLNGTNYLLRMMAIQALPSISKQRVDLALPVLEKCLNDPDSEIRWRATNAFSGEPWIHLNDVWRFQNSGGNRVPYPFGEYAHR